MQKKVEVKNIADNILRVICTNQEKIDDPTYMVEEQKAYDGMSEISVENNNGKLNFLKDNTSLFVQDEWDLKEKDIYQYTIAGDKPKIVLKKTVDGERSFVENAETIKIASAYEGQVSFKISAEEAIYGLGQNEDGIYNYRNVKEYLYQNNMKIPMPVIVSSNNYAVFFDSTCMMTYEEKDNTITVGFDAVNQIDYYVITGDCFDDLMKGIRRLTGKAVMLPKWAFGYVQSKERYKTQDEIIEVANEFKERNIPVSCIVLDWVSWEDGKWGNKIVDKTRFHDLKAMVEELHEKGIAFMVSVWPNAGGGTENNEEFAKAGKLLCNFSTYDAFDEEARAIYWKQCEEELFAAGTDAWWCDSTEPFTPDWQGLVKLSDKERYELAGDSLKKYLDAREASSYALLHAKGIYENQRAVCDTKRVVNLTRSGSLSCQKFGTILWSGDIAAKWDCMKNQIAEGLSMGMSGIPYWTLDIGAFFVGSDKGWKRMSKQDTPAPWFWNGEYEDGVDDLGYRELYVRWLQMGAFLPVMRSHGTDTPREPWNFGEPGTIYYDTIVKYINLRYRLMPYIYSLSAKVYHDEYTLMRSLMFDFGKDKEVKDISDQFMLGDAFLVAPITEPMEYGPYNEKLSAPQTRKLYLPENADWYDYETGELLGGGQWIEADAPISKMPIYVRSGSIVPISKENDGNLDCINIYEGSNGKFTLYFDNEKDYNYEKGEYAFIELKWEDDKKTLTVDSVKGNYDYPKQLSFVLHGKDQSKKEQSLSYDGKKTEVAFK